MAEKKLESYLLDADAHPTSLDAYAACPAKTFLLYVCDAYDAFHHCESKFTKKVDGSYYKDSEDSLRHISCAILGSIMGHFETYQKALFAGLLDRTPHFPEFDVAEFLKYFSKQCNTEVNVRSSRLLAFRGGTAQVGFVVADSLVGWHNPSRVNSFFKAFGVKKDTLTTKQQSDLEVLWQLRHSIVHTGAWLSLPDSQKVDRLAEKGDKPIVFEHAFVNAISRRLHKIVKHANGVLQTECKRLLGSSPSLATAAEIDAFLEVSSPKNVWL